MKKSHRNPLLLAGALATMFLALALPLEAQVDIPGPEGSVRFGAEIYALPSGNIVITDPEYSVPNGPQNVGAVYLYNGATGELISMLTGSTETDFIGNPENPGSFGVLAPAVVVLSNGNFIVKSASWQNAEGQRVGATTFVNGTTGLSGVVSPSNSLVGSTAGDLIGFGFDGVQELSNGNYIVKSPVWDNGTTEDVGAVTFGDGTTGVSGVVSASNSLVGSTEDDGGAPTGSFGQRITKLSNGSYVVSQPGWDNGAAEDAGAVTFGSGTTGVSGVVSAANSLVGSSANDQVSRVVALTNGNYVVAAPLWDNGGEGDAGAVTFGNGTSGTAGVVSPSNSLVGSTAKFLVGAGGVTTLSNGNYVVSSPNWGREVTTDPLGDPFLSAGKGAVTFADGSTGMTGEVSDSNSLVGSAPNDQVGSEGATALPNGAYLVRSSFWSGEAQGFNRGAVTFGNGTTGIKGVVSESNSLVGSTNRDGVGGDGITVLSNGNYVVLSSRWNRGVNESGSPLGEGKGAATFGDGTTGISGAVSASNSLVGATRSDRIGARDEAGGGVTALSNGNYLVSSPLWDNGGAHDAGAVTFGNGSTGISGVVSPTNSLVGSTEGDGVGSYTTALTNGNYVIGSPDWDNGPIVDAGASTFGDGTTGVTGGVSATNSLVGSTAGDEIGGTFASFVGGGQLSLVTELANGNYIISTPLWDNGGIADAGAVTFVKGTDGITGEISASNSLVGSTANDQFGFNRSGGNGVVGATIKALPNGDYTLGSPNYDHGTLVDAGAVTYGDGANGTVGTPTAENSYFGTTENARLGLPYTYDGVNNKVIISRVTENIVTLFQLPGGSLLNISTRLRVGTGENALIGGFIVTGNEPKKVIIRAIGPSLASQGVAGVLQDPTLELIDGAGTPIVSNDNWRSDQEAEIEATTIPPGNDAESAIVATLAPGAYTAVMRGAGESTGVGLVEVYDLAGAADSELANISSRGFVQTGEDVMIGGFIVGAGTRVIVRAIGPSLGNQGVAGALQDPTLQLVDANGTEVRANDNWKSDQQAEIEATGVPPNNDAESALVAALPAGNYTAVVRGTGETTGVGLVEVYNLQ